MKTHSRGSVELSSGQEQKDSKSGSSRREFIRKMATVTAGASAIPALGSSILSERDRFRHGMKKRPNIIIYHSDEFRWDFVSAAGQNPMAITPNLDSIYREGTVFQNFITNQPLCAPSRSCLFTGQYATTTGVWKNGPGLRENAVTLATTLGSAGYSTNYIGKWHLAPNGGGNPKELGFVPPRHRGGFTGLWEASNVLELTSHPYKGTIWNGDGEPMQYEDIYRVDYLTELAVKFLRQKHDSPFLLVLSQLEPHQQNDLNGFAPPKGYSEKFRNPFAPPDLRPFPGDWPYQLANYYGDIKSIDDSVGSILKTLREENLADNTVVVFLSDHGCHFRTRNTEYKRSPHESSIHVPLMIKGPGFNNSRTITELVSMIDVMPSILDMLGLKIPSSVQGQSFMPLLGDAEARQVWRNEVFIQISESETARALRTPEWTYVALAPRARGSFSLNYRDYQLYNIKADPAQVVNMAGRIDPPDLVHYVGDRSMSEITDHLRTRLIERMIEAGEDRPNITRWNYYP